MSDNFIADSTLLRLSAQRALWGNIPPSLRAVSVDYQATRVVCRFIFDGEPSDDDRDLLSAAAAEIIADFPSPWTMTEEYLGLRYPEDMQHLRYLVFLRYEP